MNSSGEALVIERLDARFRGAAPLATERCDRWLASLAEADGEALTAGLAAPDEWLLIRRLPLALRWREDSSDADVLATWQQALRGALERALARPADDAVLRYPSRRAALSDLIYRSALGDSARQWAWHRMGLVPRVNLPPAEALGHGLRALLAAPELIWPVLHGLIEGEAAAASFTAVLRGLPAADWRALLAACPRTVGYVIEDFTRPDSGPFAPAESGPATAAALLDQANPIAHELLRWAATRHHFAASRHGVLRVLIAALAWPAAGAPPALLRARLEAVRTGLTGPAATLGGTPAVETARAETAPPPARPAALPPLPALPEAKEWLATVWGGALFWLGRIPAGGLLDWQATQDQVSLPGLLRALGEALGVPAEDPALRALCGGELPRDEPAAAARAQAARQVAQWAAWLDEAAPELPEPRLAAVCRRPGQLRFEAGWIELHLPLDSADTSIRRLGLDLDPGWLPWLGCVMRIIYDDQ